MNDRLKDKIGKRAKIITVNKFYFEGELLSVSEDFVEINDRKKGAMFMRIADIALLDFYGDEDE